MKAYHAATMHHLLSSEFLQSQESISQVCDRPCPFCQREYERPIDLQHHVAGHLESTALLSLPNLDNIDENSEAGPANSNSANRNYAESRAGDFDREEPLVFLENDLSGDISSVTETRKELFRRNLEVESVPFDSMNESSVEARQGYSSGLAGEWLSRLPIGLGEESGFTSKSPSESLSNPSIASKLIELSNLLSQVHLDVGKKCESGDLPDLSTRLLSLYEKLQRLVEVASPQDLSDWQESKINAALHDFASLLAYLDDMTVKFSGITSTRLAQAEVYLIQAWLTSISARLGAWKLSYVIPARTSHEEGLTSCSFPPQVKEGAVASAGDLKTLGQSRMRSILADLITLGPSSSDSEGERLVDDQMNPSFISISFSVTGRAKEISRHQGTNNTNHWLPKVFSPSSKVWPHWVEANWTKEKSFASLRYRQSSLTTLEGNSDPPSACFGEHMPNAVARLDLEAYVSLAEFRFHDDQFIVRLYDQAYGYRPKILCCTKQPALHRKDSCVSLGVLTISRSDSLLNLTLNDGIVEPPGLWACIKFPEYESMFIRGLCLGLLL